MGRSSIVDEGMELYTVREVADRFKRTPKTVYRWIDEGFIRSMRIKGGHLIPESELKILYDQIALYRDIRHKRICKQE